MIASLAVQASLPFAALILVDEEASWRAPFAAAYAAALAVIGLVAIGPDALAAFAVSAGAAYCEDCLALALH